MIQTHLTFITKQKHYINDKEHEVLGSSKVLSCFHDARDSHLNACAQYNISSTFIIDPVSFAMLVILLSVSDACIDGTFDF